MEHFLKIEKPYYDAIRDGKKNFEIRFNDRGFQAGDTVVLQPLNDHGGYDTFAYKLTATIGYVTSFKLQEGWIAFSLLDIRIMEQSNDRAIRVQVG